MEYSNKTVLITGGSRGIGKAIAIRLAAAGANIVIAAKTAEPHPKLEGTIYSAAEEIRAGGSGKVLALQADIRNEEDIAMIVQKTTAEFGGIDILVNNASAISLTNIENTEAKRYDLMQDINVRGTYLMCQACIPLLKNAVNPHILNLSPPLNMDPKWFGKHLAYTMSKYGMSMIVLGLAQELKARKIAVNALWPKTTIATAAILNLPGGEQIARRSRNAEIMADAAFLILQKPSVENSGNFYVDEDILRENGITDFEPYAVQPGKPLMADLFL